MCTHVALAEFVTVSHDVMRAMHWVHGEAFAWLYVQYSTVQSTVCAVGEKLCICKYIANKCSEMDCIYFYWIECFMLSVWVFQTAGGCTISQQLPSDSLVVPNDSLVTPPRSHRAPQRAVIPTHSCLTITGLLRLSWPILSGRASSQWPLP
jgi:hypothetical protein